MHAQGVVVVANQSGSLRLTVSEAGLPLQVWVAPSLLCQGADAVAAEVLRLCRTGRA